MKKCVVELSTAPVFLKDVSRHRVMKAPDYFDGSLTLVTDTISRTQICEGGCDAISPLRSTDKDEDCIAPLHMMYQVLSCVAILCRVRLRFPVQKFTADGIIGIHSAWRELPLCFLEGNKGGISFDIAEVKHPYSHWSSGFKCRHPQCCLAI